MALNNANPKFHFHECPFIPKNDLRSTKNFQDEHVYKYYNINFIDKIGNGDKNKRNIINDTSEEDATHEKDANKNRMHIYYYKHDGKSSKKKREINTKSRAHDFESKTHESEGISINYGRGKEKLLNPRKSIWDGIESEIQEVAKHSVPVNKEVLSEDGIRFDESKISDNSFAEMGKSFEIDDGKEFTISAKITMTSDISEQDQCEHQSRTDKLNDCKHNTHSLSFLSENLHLKNHSNLCKKDIEREMKSYQDLDILREAEEIRKLFCDGNSNSSRINDLYEEEQFLYDPDSRQVSHIVVTKSRSYNFLEYFKDNHVSNPKTHQIPIKEIQILANESFKTIEPCKSSNKSGKLSRGKHNLIKTIQPLEAANTLPDMSAQLKFKELIRNDTDQPQDEFQIFNANDSFQKTKLATLQCIHKRPELQKRYFYHEFKAYKRKYSEDDVLYSNQVKSTREKFEKIFSKLINRNKLYCSLSNDKIGTSKAEISENSKSLKKSQRFVSEDNICLRKPAEGDLLINTSSNGNETFCKQTRARTLQSSFMKIKFSKRKQYPEEIKPALKNQTFKLNDKVASVDDISALRSNSFSTKCGKYNPKEEKFSLENHKNEMKFSSENHKNEMKSSSDNHENETKSSSDNHKISNCKTNHGMVRALDDQKLQTLNSSQTKQLDQKYTKKSVQPSNQTEKRIKNQKKENSDGKTVSEEYKNEPKIQVVIKESNKKYPEDPCYNKAVMDEIYHNSDALESFGRPISEEVLIKIRECGTSITYFGGRVICKEYGPMCSPMTMTILNEIKQYMSVLNEHFHKITDEEREI